MLKSSSAPLPSSNPITAGLSRCNLRHIVTKNGKFRILGSNSTFSTQQFGHYFNHAQVPSMLHSNSAYSVAIMTTLLKSEGFFCVVPPQQDAPTLHNWVDLVAYLEQARKWKEILNNKSSSSKNDNDDGTDKSSTSSSLTSEGTDQDKAVEDFLAQQLPQHQYKNWLHLIPPMAAVNSVSLEPDPVLQPRRRIATMAISLYASWWLQHTAGYFRWIFPLALQETEEKKRAIENVKNQSRGQIMPVETGSGTTSTKIGGVSDSVKAHARFFLLLDWGGYFVGKIVQTAMSRSLQEYGLTKDTHAFISQHLSDLCEVLNEHFRVYRYLLATEKPTLADIMLASGFEFILKDDPPRSDITDGTFRHLERFVADVTQNEAKLAELEELVAEEEAASLTAKRRKMKERHQRTQLFGFRNREKQLQQERQMLSEHKDRSSAQQTLISDESDPRQQHQMSMNSMMNEVAGRSGSNMGIKKVPMKQLVANDDEDIVPETLAPLFQLMEETFPWLHAQRNSVEDRINAFIELGSPLDVVDLPDVTGLGEFAGAKVPVVGRVPRLLPRAWEMEVDNPADAEYSQFDRATAEKLAQKSGQNAGSTNAAVAAGSSSNTIIACGTSMPHLYMTQFVAKDLERKEVADFASRDIFGNVRANKHNDDEGLSSSGVTPIPDEYLARLREQLVDLKLEEPWDVAPQFEDRADGEYVIFRRQVIDPEKDGVEIIDETKEGKKKRDREKKELKKKMKKQAGGGFLSKIIGTSGGSQP